MQFRKIFFIVILITFIVAFTYPPTVKASSDTFYISPASTSVTQGSNFTVQLRVNPSTSTSGVTATVSYNQSILQFQSLTLGAFPLCAQQSGGSGTIQISCSTSSDVNSDSLIASINFNALSGGGSNLNISNASYTDSNFNLINANAENGYVSVASTSSSVSNPGSNLAAPRTTSHNYYNSSNSPSPPTPTTSPKSIPSPPSSPIKIAGINDSIYYSGGFIAIEANQNLNGTLYYGLSPQKLNLDVSDNVNSASLSFNLFKQNLIPGTKYFYQIKLQATDGATFTTKIASFKTKGLNINVLLLSNNYQRLSNVTLHISNNKTSYVVTTNSNGTFNLSNISPGLYRATYNLKHKSYSSYLYVVNNIVTTGQSTQSAAPQTLALILDKYSLNNKNNLYIVILIGLVVIVALAYVYGYKNKNKIIYDLENYRNLIIKSHKD